MTYISLYRKWRSQDFDEIVGQPVVVQTLKNAIKNNRLAHAYLFSGPRGTGKTSTARILAKALNCKEGPTPNPCGKCDNCEKIRNGHSVDVIEIDAASNRGIDEIRELRERIRYAPLEGRYKIYIIDEVHMLTPEAFNALLKTLEEPPKHIIFVLATTELHKVPLTIASRCQRLDFGRLKVREIKEHLLKIAKEEGFGIEEKALDLIARVSEGAMRDAISLLDQLVSFAGHKVKYDDVVLLLGTADEELLFGFAEAMAEQNTNKVLELVRKGLEEGRSMVQVTRDLIFHFRNLMHIKIGSSETLEVTSDYLEKLKEQAKKFSLERLKEIVRTLSRAELDMKWHPHARLVLEVALLELLEVKSSEERVEPRVETYESKLETQSSVGRLASSINLETSTEPQITRIKEHWQAILESMRRKSIYGYVSLQEGEPIEINSKGKLVIAFNKGYTFHKERLEESKNKEALEESIREVLGQRLPIECVMKDGEKPQTLSVKAVAEFFEGRVVS